MSIENWPAMPITPAMGAPCKTELAVRAEALGARLRDTAEALREMTSSHWEHRNWCGTFSIKPRCACGLDNAHAILKQLKQEGLA